MVDTSTFKDIVIAWAVLMIAWLVCVGRTFGRPRIGSATELRWIGGEVILRLSAELAFFLLCRE